MLSKLVEEEEAEDDGEGRKSFSHSIWLNGMNVMCVLVCDLDMAVGLNRPE